MPVITAWQCPYSKKVFSTRSGYARHLSKLREKRSIEFQRKYIEGFRAEFYSNMRRTCVSAEDIQNFIMENWNKMMRMEMVRRGLRVKRIATLEQVTITARYQERCSNTHSCPFDGVTNWHCRDELPRGYPGFNGSIEMKFSEYLCDGISSSEVLAGTGINTGSGGGGEYMRYDITIFLADWPNLQIRMMEETLKGNKFVNL